MLGHYFSVIHDFSGKHDVQYILYIQNGNIEIVAALTLRYLRTFSQNRQCCTACLHVWCAAHGVLAWEVAVPYSLDSQAI